MRKKIRCASCAYHGGIPSGGVIYCDYLRLTGHRRPCACGGPGGVGCEAYRTIEEEKNECETGHD